MEQKSRSQIEMHAKLNDPRAAVYRSDCNLRLVWSLMERKVKFPIRLATSRPLGEWSEHCLAAKRPTASDEVARSTCLAWWFSIHILHQKWGVAWLLFGVSGFICESLTSMAECVDSTPTKSIECVCVSPSSKEQICLLYEKVVSNNDFWRKLMTSGGRKKTKTCFNLESILGKEISQPRNPWHPHTF